MNAVHLSHVSGLDSSLGGISRVSQVATVVEFCLFISFSLQLVSHSRKANALLFLSQVGLSTCDLSCGRIHFEHWDVLKMVRNFYTVLLFDSLVPRRQHPYQCRPLFELGSMAKQLGVNCLRKSVVFLVVDPTTYGISIFSCLSLSGYTPGGVVAYWRLPVRYDPTYAVWSSV